MKLFKADLHIHSCLSPCADLDMTPRGIIEMSLQKGLDIIAVSDHNSAENVGAVIRAAQNRNLTVLPGLEVSSREEVHCLAFFNTLQQALDLQDIIYKALKGTNRPDIFGDQVIANECDEVEGFNDRRLIGATELTLKEIVNQVHRLGGLSIASHIDRPSYSIISQLGFIPDDLHLDALEITDCTKGRELPINEKFTLVSFSDAHTPDEIGRAATFFWLQKPCVNDIRLALKNESGRRVGE